MALWEAASAGRVPPEPILRPLPDYPQGNRPRGIPRQTTAEATAELSRAAANQMRGAFAVSAMQAQRSMAEAFPGEPIHEEWPELRTARSAIYLIGLAVQQSILLPLWECPVPYRRILHIRRLGFTLNAAALEGRALSWDDFGGLRRYLALLDYCAASADAAEKSGTRGASRTLPEGPRPSRAGFGGVIGAPEPLEEEPENGTDARAPRGTPVMLRKLPPTPGYCDSVPGTVARTRSAGPAFPPADGRKRPGSGQRKRNPDHASWQPYQSLRGGTVRTGRRPPDARWGFVRGIPRVVSRHRAGSRIAAVLRDAPHQPGPEAKAPRTRQALVGGHSPGRERPGPHLIRLGRLRVELVSGKKLVRPQRSGC